MGLSCLDLTTSERVVPDLAKAVKRLKGSAEQGGHMDADPGLVSLVLRHRLSSTLVGNF